MYQLLGTPGLRARETVTVPLPSSDSLVTEVPPLMVWVKVPLKVNGAVATAVGARGGSTSDPVNSRAMRSDEKGPFQFQCVTPSSVAGPPTSLVSARMRRLRVAPGTQWPGFPLQSSSAKIQPLARLIPLWNVNPRSPA